MPMPMKWSKSPPALVATFEAVVPGGPGVEARKMFGYPACFADGNMFMGLFETSFIVRLGDDARAELLAVVGSRTFEPMPGRPMKEYVAVAPKVVGDHAALRGWVKRALAHVRALPPKATKGAKASKATSGKKGAKKSGAAKKNGARKRLA